MSSAPTAVTVRATVRHLIEQGQSDQQIKDYLVARYGSAIVLDPSTSGWSALVWVLPIVAGLAAVAALAVVLARRRRRGSGHLDADMLGPSVDPVAREERRRFLTQSLDDADAEYLAGDLSDADYLVLRQRDLARLSVLGPAGPLAHPSEGGPVAAGTTSATATATLDAERPEPVTHPTPKAAARRRGRNKWFLIGAIACFGAALIVAVPVFSSNRLPGQTATGAVSLSPSQQVSRSLDQAATVEDEGQLGLAAQLYQSVLNAHPDNEVALAQLGWLEYKIGQQGASATLISDARVKLAKAARLNPGDYAVHLYLGTLLLQLDGNAAGAVDEFAQFLAADPPDTVVSQAAPTLRQAFAAAGKPLPVGVPAA